MQPRFLKKLELSSCHREAVEVTITLPATTMDVAELLSQQHSKEKEVNRKMLLKILSSIDTWLGKVWLSEVMETNKTATFCSFLSSKERTIR